jgi:hypothetical protein
MGVKINKERENIRDTHMLKSTARWTKSGHLRESKQVRGTYFLESADG